MSQMPKYSLWLCPDPESDHRYSDTIITLSTKYRSPLFRPHVTLLGTLPGDRDELAQKLEKLAAEMKPIGLVPLDFAYEPLFFRSLYLKLEASEALIALQKKAVQLFGIDQESVFFPHISLMYGGNDQENLINELPIELLFPFYCNSLRLVQTNGPVTIWNGVAEVQLDQ